MIRLSDKKPFAVGEERDVYFHPNDQGKLIKIAQRPPGKNFKPEGFRDWLFWITRMKNEKLFDCNYTDALFYRKLQERNDPHVYDHLPKCYGLVETDIGKGLVCEIIRNDDGSPCMSLRDYCRKGDELRDEKLIESLDLFFDWLVKKNIFLRQMGATNTIFQHRNDGSVQAYHIDAVGCLDLLPLANYAAWFSRLRIAIKINHFRRRRLKIVRNPPMNRSENDRG